MSDIDCKNFDIDVVGNPTGVTPDGVAGVFRYAYDNARVFTYMIDHIQHLNGQVQYSVDESFESQYSQSQGDGIHNTLDDTVTTLYSPGSEYDAVVHLPPGGYDGDAFIYGGGTGEGRISLMYNLVHETIHAYIQVKKNRGWQSPWQTEAEEETEKNLRLALEKVLEATNYREY